MLLHVLLDEWAMNGLWAVSVSLVANKFAACGIRKNCPERT